MGVNGKGEDKMKTYQEMTVAEKIERVKELRDAATTKSQKKDYSRQLSHLREELRESRQPKRATVILTGRVVRETAKAIYFKVAESHDMAALLGGSYWFPKSQVEVLIGAMGPSVDQVICPEWLAKAKSAE